MASNGAPEKIETRLFINGKFVESSDKKTFPLYAPSTREHVADVFEATVADTNAAVAAAKAAQPAWAALSPTERGVPMKKLAALLRDPVHAARMAYLEAVSMGRPLAMYHDGAHCATKFETFATTGWDAQGTTSLNTPGVLAMTFRQPYGVAAAIIPWNGPAVFVGEKVAPMVAAGNAVVVKSSEKAPLTTAYISTLIDQAGFPPGVINVLHGHGPVSGATLSSHMDVRVISFTGSGRTGRLICEAAAKSNLKNVHLELGGKSPSLIFDDADLDRAAAETQFSMSMNTGQVCMANSRILVQDTVADAFKQKFRDSFAAVRVGASTDDGVQMGPLADEVQFKTVTNYIQLAKDAGGKLLLDADAQLPSDAKDKGFFVGPHIFTDLPEDSRPAREEIFGPVVVIGVFKTEEEAVRRANDTEYGLYASVYTKDVSRAIRVAKALESGTVGVNCTSPTIVHDMPFGGYKASGLGREGIHHSLNNFLEEKTVVVRI
ncbi:Aldehyde dehydrogenase [Lasiodiplodia theobromae]|uniref:aldehyde dehydrogenase (NAD(+)) n=1 Tax=Lasiodiplodia theobromae TaxID=45133 RepID=A0A5N5D7X8_9PEZI|nr:Aldehyde dehydrogenase [Lasiodiplodia theobromae]